MPLGRTMAPDPVLLPEALAYEDFAVELQESCLVGDPWVADSPIFRAGPALVSPELLEDVFAAGAAVGALYDELTRIVSDSPELLDSFYALLPHYKLMQRASGAHWHGFARMDMFLLEDGRLQVCELNADTPTGQVEALVPARLLAPRYPELLDVNRDYARRFVAMTRAVHAARCPERGPLRRLGIVYPTDLPEDITLVRFFAQWFEADGVEVVLGAPGNLRRGPSGKAALFGAELDAVLRLYKTDWWGERPQIFAGDPAVPDPEPLTDALLLLLEAEAGGHTAVVNPFGSLVAQDKLSLAFFWEEMDRFSPTSQDAIRALIPMTLRLDGQDREQVKRERERWVLKSDFGCEGDEVMLGPLASQEAWERAVDAALPQTWVVQEYFQARPLLEDWVPNYGVYLTAGAPSGLLLRITRPSADPSDIDARVLPAFIPRG